MNTTSAKPPLWSWGVLATITEGTADGVPSTPITGVSIDSRTIGPGDFFIALKDARDGHDFVPTAFANAAAAALVSKSYQRKPGDAALLRVADPLRSLEDIGRIARFRTDAKVVAVTGSVGKTSTKEMLRACLSAFGRTHASEKSYNNHWGVPLTLARMPEHTEFGVFEIGMNHPGEITPLTRMVAPDIAIITTVAPVHLEHFANEEAIADAKAEIFIGVRRGGVVILNADIIHFARLEAAASALGHRIVSFGTSVDAHVRATSIVPDALGSDVTATIGGRSLTWRVGMPGRHMALNSLAVAATVHQLGLDLETALAPLAVMSPPSGRGAREQLDIAGGQVLLVDESYNANPASMRAALSVLSTVPREEWPRRLAVLGDMRELGHDAGRLHRELAQDVIASGADQVLLCGEHMRELFDALPSERRTAHTRTSLELVPALKSAVRPGDVIVVKGSLGTNMAPLVATLRAMVTTASTASEKS